MNKAFRATEVKRSQLVLVECCKGTKLKDKTIGKMIKSIQKLPKQLYDYTAFPFGNLDDLMEQEVLIKFSKKRQKLFKIEPVIVRVIEMRIPNE